MMVEVLKQAGTWHVSSEVLEMSVNTGDSWSAQCFRVGGETEAPFKQPVQGGNVAPLCRLAVRYKRYEHGMGGHCCYAGIGGSQIAGSTSV